MKKHHKRILGMGILVIMLFMIMPFSVIAENTKEATIEMVEEEEGGEGEEEGTTEDTDIEGEDRKQEVLNNDSISDTCKRFVQEWNVSPAMFGVTMKYDGDNDQFELSMNVPNAYSGASRKNVKFKILKIEILEIPKNERDEKIVKQTYRDLEAEFAISNETRLTDGKTIIFKNNQTAPGRFRIYLVADGFQDSYLRDACGSRVKYTIYKEYDFYGKINVSEIEKSVKVEESPVVLGEVKCDGSKEYLPNSFEALFCADMAAAKDAEVLTFTEKNNTYAKVADGAKKYYCDPFTLVKTPNTASSKYFVANNTKYLRGTSTYEITEDDYVYNYGGQDKKGKSYNEDLIDKEAVGCEVTCNEIVTVKYGPPVASKAGLCFEYQVEVTSRVNCFMTQSPKLPKYVTIEDGEYKIRGSYCTPSPGCDHGNGYVDLAAGPNEDFEACVSSCDGGKYTTKCSTKCYKEVYGKKTTSKKTTAFDLEDMPAPIALWKNNTLDRTMEKNGIGQYYNDRGVIKWRPANHIGRWYVENNYNTGHKCLKTEAEGGGISAVCGCYAKCRWNGCAGKVYLNPYSITRNGTEYKTTYTDGTTPVATELRDMEGVDINTLGELERDAIKNIEKYKRVITRCQSQSKCSTTQATFSISVNYNDGSKDGKTVYFPYTSKNDSNAKDTIQRDQATGLVKCSKKNSDYSTIVSSNGCYNCNGNAMNTADSQSSSARWYQTVWGFPGTWIHNKTGEISYEPKGSGWKKQEKKFCLPLNAQNVNTKWWNYYQTSLFGPTKDEGVQYSYNNANYIKSIRECDSSTADIIRSLQEKSMKFTEQDAAEIKYNIQAKTRKFGLYEWDIDINCFYAINSTYLATDEKNVSTTSDDVKEALECMGLEAAEKKEMRIRSVDLNNLFPEPNGTTLSNTQSTGRTPGFNWSQYATNMRMEDYPSQPSEYLKWVQKKGYDIYDEEYLDYEIKLTRQQIKEIKTLGEDYTKYDGKTNVGDVTHYVSTKLLRDILKDGSKIPDEAALKCNNLRNYNSIECAESGKGGVD